MKPEKVILAIRKSKGDQFVDSIIKNVDTIDFIKSFKGSKENLLAELIIDCIKEIRIDNAKRNGNISQKKIIDSMFKAFSKKEATARPELLFKYQPTSRGYSFTDSYRCFYTNDNFGYELGGISQRTIDNFVPTPEQIIETLKIDIDELKLFIKTADKKIYTLKGNKLTTNWNAKYLLDALQFANNNTIHITGQYKVGIVYYKNGDVSSILAPCKV